MVCKSKRKKKSKSFACRCRFFFFVHASKVTGNRGAHSWSKRLEYELNVNLTEHFENTGIAEKYKIAFVISVFFSLAIHTYIRITYCHNHSHSVILCSVMTNVMKYMHRLFFFFSVLWNVECGCIATNRCRNNQFCVRINF